MAEAAFVGAGVGGGAGGMWRTREERSQCRVWEERRHAREEEVVVPCTGER